MISLDWDDINLEEAERRLDMLQGLEFTKMRLWNSPSGKGFHVEIFGLKKTWEEQIELREKFWDDPKRIQFDSARIKKGICCNILFDKKGKNSSTHVKTILR